jgi:hypothetical protein
MKERAFVLDLMINRLDFFEKQPFDVILLNQRSEFIEILSYFQIDKIAQEKCLC